MPRDDRDPSFDRAQDESRGGGASGGASGSASRNSINRSVASDAVSREDVATEENSGELERLLKLAAGGDSSAWRAIVALYAPRVFGIVRAQCRDDELSEEIVQSTFCTLAAKIASYVESGRFESWLFRIAMNRLRDEMRRRSRQARSSTDEAFVGMPDTRERGGRGLAPEVRSKLELALARLSESDREIIDLRHTGGLSFKALSDYYEEPVGTLLARHHRALKKLKAILEDLGVDGTDVGGGAPAPSSRRGDGAT
jgi:RNA polymerase sigma-70 factor (ECF subfamily)